MDKGLVADIGRNSVRFGLVDAVAFSNPHDVCRFGTNEHTTFTSALVSYLRKVGLEGQRLPSAFAVAGAVRGDVINLTGSRWFISLSGIEAVLRQRPQALNECAAIALALPMLEENRFVALPGAALRSMRPEGRYLLVVPGTGLGVSALIPGNGRSIPVQSEAAHMSFVAETADEQRLIAAFARKGIRPTNEAVVSARGLMAAQALFCTNDHVATSPEEVTAGMDRDAVSIAAASLFASALARIARDLALAFGAWDGVFLAGPIVHAMRRRLAAPDFRIRFEGDGPFRRDLAQVPLALVEPGDWELVGAAAALAA